MFIRNKDLKIILTDTFNIDISLKQLDKLVKIYEKQSGFVINRVWNDNSEARLDFIAFVREGNFNIALKINPPLPKNFHLCENPYKYDNMREVDKFIASIGKIDKYMGVKCGKCKKFHMVKIKKDEKQF